MILSIKQNEYNIYSEIKIKPFAIIFAQVHLLDKNFIFKFFVNKDKNISLHLQYLTIHDISLQIQSEKEMHFVE